jgi:NAD(P)H-hydrate epimerase
MALNADEMHVLDGNAEFLGVPTGRLMENAGFAVAEAIKKKYKLLGKKVVILCGTGNNGGDGFVVARNLLQYCQVQVCLIKPPDEIRTDISRANFEKVKRLALTVNDTAGLKAVMKDADIIVDALLGVGAKGELAEPYKSWVGEVNKSGKTIISVDVPSGLGSGVFIHPSMTVTFHEIKDGMDKKNSGEIVTADIGIPEDAETYVGPGEFVFYPVPREHSHKGDNGRLLIVGGGPYTGAPALAGLAAYRVGIDLVRIATSRHAYPIIAKYSPNFIVHRLSAEDCLVEADVPHLLSLLKNADAAIIGPGLGDAKETAKAVQMLLLKCEKPVVIDADAIAAAGEKLNVLKNITGVITPHAGEFYDLTGKKLDDDFTKKCKHVMWSARDLGMTLILKGRVDIITDGARTKLNRTGNPGMTVGGTGDVLAGIVGGLLAKGVTPFNAARMGAFINGYAGDLAFREKSYGLMATDVVEKIPEVLRQFVRQ